MQRGKYRQYQYDPEKPIPKTTRWRMKRSADGTTGSKDLLPNLNQSGLEKQHSSVCGK